MIWDMEAGTGIEPVFTDLQSNQFPSENKDVGPEKYRDMAGTSRERDTRSRPRAPSLSEHMLDRHKRATRALGYALILDDRQHWTATAVVWEARLTPAERYNFARSVMLAMKPSELERLFGEVLGGAGAPMPFLLEPVNDAQWWASLASPPERRAYCLAAFLAMSPREQGDFLAFVRGGRA